MKGNTPWQGFLSKSKEFLSRYKYVALVIAVGVVLLVIPFGKEGVQGPTTTETAVETEDFSVAELERKLSETLSRIHGAGDVTVMLTVQGGSRRVLAQDEDLSRQADGASSSQHTTVVLDQGTGAGKAPVMVQQLYPQFQGALVVCEGGGDPAVRLKLMEAVSALTGLGANRISICKGKG